ncbi:hypothetical protein ACIRVF_15815 [Kitasatospora sp. NPDC101157]|uniref:hypothetical protein n=1 Tax=Kitasatospora sp. NPDC101157 TaxID=3364098 RepID=UPI003802AA7C
MKSIVAGQYAVGSEEFAELALGVDEELFAGVAGESALQRQARLDVAYEVLADLRREDPALAAYAEKLLKRAPVPLHAARRPVGPVGGLGVAA